MSTHVPQQKCSWKAAGETMYLKRIRPACSLGCPSSFPLPFTPREVRHPAGWCVLSKVFQQLSSSPRNNTNLEGTAASPGKLWLSPPMGEQWCSHTSGWASAPLAVLDRTGWSTDRNPSAYYSVCCSLEIKDSQRSTAANLTVLLCYRTSWHHPSQTLYCLPPLWGKKKHHNRGPFVLHFATSAYSLDQNQRKQTSWKNTANSTAVWSTKVPSIPPTSSLCEISYGFNWCRSFSQGSCPESLTHGAFKIWHHKYFQLLQMIP